MIASIRDPGRRAPRRFSHRRGSVLLTAMLLAIVIAIGLAGYITLSRTSLKLAHRTFFANDAINLAEAGLEEAINCFNLMGAGTTPATAWAGWTISGTDAMRTLTPFSRDQRAVGIVKVHIHGYDGSNAAPDVISQATITPFGGSVPVVRILRIALKPGSKTVIGIMGLNGMTMKNVNIMDSFNSNPGSSPSGPWVAYSIPVAHANAPVVVTAGSVNLGTGKIYGNLSLGPGVTPPPASQVTGTIQSNYPGTYTLPTYPTATSVSQSYNVGNVVPATLPRTGDLPASDGRYYYFCNGVTLGTITITTGNDVTIVGTNTKMSSGLTIQTRATCYIYIDRDINLAKGRDINNSDWAGALQIFTSGTGNCNFGDKSQFVGCFHAPYAPLTATGNDASNMLVGSFVAKSITLSGNYDIHYDEALGLPGTGTGQPWVLTSWYELQSAADRAAVAGMTGNFLP